MNNELVEQNNSRIFYTSDDGQVEIEVRIEKENLTTASDGKKYNTNSYSLDAIIAIG